MSCHQTRLNFSPTPTSYFCLALLLFSICFGWLLPPEYGRENGPVEWLQVVVLGFAAVVAIGALFQTYITPSRRKLIAVSSILLLLAIIRELSWGRVFYMDNAGNIPPLKTLWFGSYVYPSISLVFIGFCVYFFSQGLHKEVINWTKYDPLPVFDIILILVAKLTSDIIEHNMGGFFGNRADLFEELFELISYFGVLSFMINVVFSKKYHSAKTFKFEIKA